MATLLPVEAAGVGGTSRIGTGQIGKGRIGKTLDRTKQAEAKGWNFSATASTLAQWVAGILFAENLNIQAIVLSVREDGVFIDAGSVDGVTVGQVYEIYRAAHDTSPEEVAGRVQVAWVREDYCFANPVGQIDLSRVSTLHFARLIHVPPALTIVSDTSLGGDAAQLDQLIDATGAILIARTVKLTGVGSREPSWRLVLTPDKEGQSVGASLTSPGGDIAGTIVVDPATGRRLANEAWLDPSYLSGTASPFERFLAPPGRRSVKIASGDLVPGGADELAVLDGSDLYVYDLSGAEPRLLNSLTVSIPPSPTRFREDAGSLELIDLDGNGVDEVCIAPPGGSRGEVWSYSGDTWVPLGFLPHPARTTAPGSGAVLVGQYLGDFPALDPAGLSWFYPLTQKEPVSLGIGFSPIAVASMPGATAQLPEILAINRSGILYRVSPGIEPLALPGSWGDCVRVAGDSEGAVGLLTKPSINSDVLTLVDPVDGNVLAEFPYPDGPIIDIATGDVDRDGKAEILIAAIHPEGVRIYY
jgi:hypothetical protein